MPSTEYNVSRIVERITNYSRAQVLEVLNEVQLIVYSQDVEQTLYLDPATGLPPFITTTAGVFHYDCPVNCRRTAQVFSRSLNNTYSRSRPVGPRKEYYFMSKGYHLIAVSSRDALPGGVLATIDFQEDPGDSTDKYYHLFYILPTELTSEDIQLTIPEELHYDMRRAVFAMLSTENYGENGYDGQIMDMLSRKIRNKLNGGAQADIGKTNIREEYQEFPDSGSYGYRF